MVFVVGLAEEEFFLALVGYEYASYHNVRHPGLQGHHPGAGIDVLYHQLPVKLVGQGPDKVHFQAIPFPFHHKGDRGHSRYADDPKGFAFLLGRDVGIGLVIKVILFQPIGFQAVQSAVKGHLALQFVHRLGQGNPVLAEHQGRGDAFFPLEGHFDAVPGAEIPVEQGLVADKHVGFADEQRLHGIRFLGEEHRLNVFPGGEQSCIVAAVDGCNLAAGEVFLAAKKGCGVFPSGAGDKYKKG